MGKSQAEIDEMPSREHAEYFVLMAGLENFDGRDDMERALDKLAGIS